MYFQHLCTHNDRYDNPRCLFVLVDEGRRVAVWDEKHYGVDAVPGIWRDAAYRAERLEITPGLYNELKRNLPSPEWVHEVFGCNYPRELQELCNYAT